MRKNQWDEKTNRLLETGTLTDCPKCGNSKIYKNSYSRPAKNICPDCGYRYHEVVDFGKPRRR